MALRLRRSGKVCSAEDAVQLIATGACITISGVLGWLWPAKVMRALELRFLSQGAPANLTWFDPFPTGLPGLESLSYPGHLKRVICGWLTPYPRLCALIQENRVEAYMYPLGSMGFLCQQIAAGREGFLTPVGLGTYIDPRNGGGRLNAAAREDLVTLVHVEGKEYLWYKAFPIDVAIIRGTTIDEAGNLSLENEHATMNILYQAMAAKRCGGVVIAQARRLVAEGSINPQLVAVPGVLVDAIVLDPDQHPDEINPEMDWLLPWDRLPKPPRTVIASPDPAVWRAWLHEGKLGSEERDPQPLKADTVIARRSLLEIDDGDVVNVGAGLPARELLPLAAEEGVDERCILSIEPGHLGGWVNGAFFRAGATAILDTPDIFSLYSAGLVRSSFLSMLQFDREGSVNLLRYGDKIVGPGGALDIAHATQRVIFTGTLTADGLKTEASDGRLRIVQEGRAMRAVTAVEAVCFNGPMMFAQGKEVLYITERAVFRLTAGGVMLTEVAPGVDAERDVVAHMEFRPLVGPDLRIMDERAYRVGPMGALDRPD